MHLIKTGRWLTLSGYFGLMAGLYAWHLWLNDTADHRISVLLLLQIGPLLFALKGLLNGRIYTHAWSIYLAIAYFVMGVWYSSADSSFLFGLYMVGCSLLFLVGTAMYTRYASRALKGSE
jgi:uncharacterized membrane protein